MTSSLVGSEMCIRDRSCGGPCGIMFRVRAYSARQPCVMFGGRCNSAVSYTHLTLPTICSV
eukprot:12765550-Prorocentrum_lima.AAC.1